jgi:hypothetical protein
MSLQNIIDLALQRGWKLQKKFGSTQYDYDFLVPPSGHCATGWAAEFTQVMYNGRPVAVPHYAAEFIMGKRCPKTGSCTNPGACPRGGHYKN